VDRITFSIGEIAFNGDQQYRKICTVQYKSSLFFWLGAELDFFLPAWFFQTETLAYRKIRLFPADIGTKPYFSGCKYEKDQKRRIHNRSLQLVALCCSFKPTTIVLAVSITLKSRAGSFSGRNLKSKVMFDQLTFNGDQSANFYT
jgi:hypothetical protein